MAEPKPFHEAIVDETNAVNTGARVGWAESQCWAALSVLSEVTERSVLPKNHDAIQDSFEVAFAELGMRVPNSLIAHIAAEKARAEKKAADMSIDNVQSGPTGLLAIANR